MEGIKLLRLPGTLVHVIVYADVLSIPLVRSKSKLSHIDKLSHTISISAGTACAALTWAALAPCAVMHNDMHPATTHEHARHCHQLQLWLAA